jgi:hypothetical protein
MTQPISIRARMEKILSEVGEARREEALCICRKFRESDKVGVAEMLADAYTVKCFDELKIRLIRLSATDYCLSDLNKIYLSLGLNSSGAERS